jgi:hypothetical protein
MSRPPAARVLAIKGAAGKRLTYRQPKLRKTFHGSLGGFCAGEPKSFRQKPLNLDSSNTGGRARLRLRADDIGDGTWKRSK